MSGQARGGGGRISQSVPVAPPSPHFGSVKAPPELLEAMPSLELPQSVSDHVSSLRHQVARSAPADDLLYHSFRVPPKSAASGSRHGATSTLVEEGEQVAGSLGQSLVSALSSLRVRNNILETELDNQHHSAEEEEEDEFSSAVAAPIHTVPLPSSSKKSAKPTASAPTTTLGKPSKPRDDDDEEDEYEMALDHDDELQFELT